MEFERLAKFKKVLLYVSERISLENDINNRISLVNSILADANFNHNFFLNYYQECLERNSKILEEMAHSINKVDSVSTKFGLDLSNDIEYNNFFSEDNIKNVIGGLNQDEGACQIVRSALFKYVSWQHPTLFLDSRTTFLHYIDDMVSGDPLYIAGANFNYLLKWIEKYPKIYQKRLRMYNIFKGNLSQLPQQQFGFIFCWELFNLLSIAQVEQYIKNIYNLLKPGGVLMFSYNNAEIEQTARMIDAKFFPWASKNYINQILISLNYEIINFIDLELDDGTYNSWVEVKKPGELHTIKKHQVLGKIEQT
jgi:SAM-dependent methyltransferase